MKFQVGDQVYISSSTIAIAIAGMHRNGIIIEDFFLVLIALVLNHGTM